jgi:transcriptional regulator with XRE-family HTH domain
MIVPHQIRAARAALGWSAFELAGQCGLSLRTIQNMEAGGDVIPVRKSSILAVKAALEAAGIEFIGSPEDAPGIRIHSRR